MRIALFALLALVATPACAGPISDRIYPAPRAPLTLDGLPAGAEIVEVRTADGLALKGVAIAARANMPTMLVFHGNASAASGTVGWLAPLVSRGYGVVAASYRGYSANPGSPSEKGLAADADAFYALAKARAQGRPVIVLGHSLGGGVGFGLARRVKLDALVTIGTFTGMRAMAPKLARAFIADRYDNLGAVPTLDEPFFLIHGTADQVVPAQQGNALHNAAVRAKRVGASFVLDGAGHRPDGETIAAAVDAVAAFLARPGQPLIALAGGRVFPFAP